MAAAKASFLFSPSPAPEVFITTRLCKLFPSTQKPSFPSPSSSSSSSTTLTKVLNADAVYTKLPPRLRTARQEQERDAISLLNERIRREHAKRDQSPLRPAMDSEEADKYIQLVKEQQQRGLQKLKSDRAKQGASDDAAQATFSYKVDPYTLRSGDYVVHRKVGIGRFVGIKFDVPKDSKEPIEYVFIEYADGMAKLPVKQASRLLYRYNLPNETKRPRTLSKLSDTSAWERRRMKGKVAVQKMVVDLMELYLHRLKQKRPPYPKTSAMAEFASHFPFEPTPDQKQ
ncbi:hypothetical protein HAX54_037585, partial [Datura stramonium]|nr:hypothetical protein [Datura stramonium]